MGQGEQDVALGLYGKKYQIDLAETIPFPLKKKRETIPILKKKAETIPQSEKNQTYRLSMFES